MMSKTMGFNFEEDELPPKLRKELGDVAAKLDYHHNLVDNLYTARSAHKAACGFWGFVFVVFLLCCIATVLVPLMAFVDPSLAFVFTNPIESIVVLAIFFFPFSSIAYFSFKKMRSDDITIKEKEKEVASCWSDINNRVKMLAHEAYNEMSMVYEAKVRPTVKHVVIDFASIIRAARGRGIFLDTIECPHCKGAVEIPESGEYFKCKYCGKAIYATKIFDKIKGMLKE